MFFAIFKLPRTGSTRLSKFLNRAAEVRCFHETLNKCEDEHYAAEISRRLESRDERCRGFTLNPFKHKIQSDAFFDPQPYVGAQGRSFVASLVRKDTFQQAVSYWLSLQLQMWPGDSDANMAGKLNAFVEQGGIEIPPQELEALCQRFVRLNRRLTTFSNEFANRNSLDHLAISYEGIYNAPHSDIDALESKLGVVLDRELVNSAKKVLPQPEDWIVNFDQLAHLYTVNTQ